MPETPVASTIVNPPANEIQPDRDTELEGSLSALFKSSPEVQPEVVETPKETRDPVKPEEPSKPDQPVADTGKTEPREDKQDLGDENTNEKPTKSGWENFRNNYKKAKKTIAEKDQELAKVKAALAEKGQFTSQEAEVLKKEIEDLKSYRAMVDVQADPEFLQKYDEPIDKKKEAIARLFTEWKIPNAEEVVKYIDFTDTTALERTENTIAENKDKISAKKFLRLAEEINELYDKRTENLDQYRKDYKNILETKKKEAFSKQAENEGRLQKRLEAIGQMPGDNGQPRFPYVREISAKDPSNAAELEQVQRHNKIVEITRAKFGEYIKAETPEDKADVAFIAANSHILDAQLKAALDKIKSLQEENSKISKVSSSTPRSQKTTVNHNNGNVEMDAGEALSSFLSSRQ